MLGAPLFSITALFYAHISYLVWQFESPPKLRYHQHTYHIEIQP